MNNNLNNIKVKNQQTNHQKNFNDETNKELIRQLKDELNEKTKEINKIKKELINKDNKILNLQKDNKKENNFENINQKNNLDQLNNIKNLEIKVNQLEKEKNEYEKKCRNLESNLNFIQTQSKNNCESNNINNNYTKIENKYRDFNRVKNESLVLNEKIKNDNTQTLKEKICKYEKEINQLKEENRLNKNLIDNQKNQIFDLKEKINKKDEAKITSENNKMIDEKENEITRLKRKVNKLIINLSQKDQNILVLNDDLVELEDKLKELNDKNKTINQENDKFKKLLIQNNIKF